KSTTLDNEALMLAPCGGSFKFSPAFIRLGDDEPLCTLRTALMLDIRKRLRHKKRSM
ncbi:hypothetical protein A2U01_0039894, partial [Trifolium medium]|nr:hypothetical protein [Trifolium medium]